MSAPVQRVFDIIKSRAIYIASTSEPCRAGGLLNWAAIGIEQEHSNYSMSHVTGWDGRRHTTNCWYCGKEVL